MQELPKIAIIGNPNTGKSVIFNLLTKRYATVSNYPGTTVEIMSGSAIVDLKRYNIIDTPGVNNLIPTSEDEAVARDILLEEEVWNIIQVVDAKNLRRGLFITLQLAEMEVPFALCLNMWDEAAQKRISIDVKAIETVLGVSVFPTIATQRYGVNALFSSIHKQRRSGLKVSYGNLIEEAIKKLEPLIPSSNISKRSLSIMLLSGDRTLLDWLSARLEKDTIGQIETVRSEIQSKFAEPIAYVINKIRMRSVERIVLPVLKTQKDPRFNILESFGRLAIHRFWGIPILLLNLFLMYKIVGEFGAGTAVNYLENAVFGKYIIPAVTKMVDLLPFTFIRELLVGQYGLITMALTYSLAIILPIVGTFFLYFGFIEDVGYLPRLGVMADRACKLFGLNGKAVLPLVLGLGCDTMATMTGRILDTKRERIIVTLLLALAIPCSAQLGVILGILGSQPKSLFIWLGVIIAVLFLVGYLAAKVLPGETASFILEIPPVRIPKFSNILMKTIARMEWYLKEAVPLFILGTLALFLLDKFQFLKIIEQALSPVISGFLGLPAKAAGAFIIGFLRRDYGAAGFYVMAQHGEMDKIQILVSLITITLFVPCIAQFFVTIKERGIKVAIWMSAFILPFSFLVGGLMNFILRYFKVAL